MSILHESSPPMSTPFFDAYAMNYDQVLNSALAASGETKEYFARGRLAWLAGRLKRLDFRANRVLDFGCGTGTAASLFIEYLGAHEVLGVDVSPASLAIAAQTHQGIHAVRFLPLEQHEPAEDYDLVFTNGVFHHISLDERLPALKHVSRSLRPGGVFAFWENNSWNPGTRHCMRVNPFDRESNAISPVQGRRLLVAAGFEILQSTYVFYFPRCLRWLRRLESRLARLPLGAQYLVLARKPLNDRRTLEHDDHGHPHFRTLVGGAGGDLARGLSA